jgi:hypothetical protein
MGIVASNKKVLEINETYRHWQQPVGGRDEAHDATAAGSSGQNSSSVSTQPEERKEHDLERASRAHGIQSRLCQARTATTWSTTEAGKQSLVVDVRLRSSRCRVPFYDEKVKAALIKIWKVMDYICGKRMQPALAEMVRVLERHDELRCDPVTRTKLLQISAATIDRLLRTERRKYELRGKARTKPGTLLKHQIPIRTFAEWDEQQPGFGEIDLVGHDGGVAAGDYCQTLDLTDIATTWTETMAVRNKAQARVFEALQKVRKNLPFPLLGLDSDNGSEFINDELLRYCQQQQISFTRSRPYRKNDSCFVEQKNYSIVRRAVGYARYDTDEQCQLLNELYSYLRLYTNFFLPTMKLKSKEREGSRVKKYYDQALTPYQRVLAIKAGEQSKERAVADQVCDAQSGRFETKDRARATTLEQNY